MLAWLRVQMWNRQMCTCIREMIRAKQGLRPNTELSVLCMSLQISREVMEISGVNFWYTTTVRFNSFSTTLLLWQYSSCYINDRSTFMCLLLRCYCFYSNTLYCGTWIVEATYNLKSCVSGHRVSQSIFLYSTGKSSRQKLFSWFVSKMTSCILPPY